MKLPKSPLTLTKALVFSAFSIPFLLQGQDAAETSPVEEDEVIVLEEIQADNNVPIEDSILPTTRPFVSVYGTEKNILETPRNVTILSREQLDAIRIDDPRDFSRATSSSYTQSNFGAPANPSIRGQTADILLNGMRKGLTTNGNGLPLNFNAVESAAILKGPPSVLVGASQYVGGYVDLITKKPNFAGNSVEFSSTVDSEGLFKAEIDANYVFSEDLAARASYSANQAEDYFWNFHKRKTQALYGAVVWTPNESYRLEVNAEGFYADYTENWGWNRVNQQLIDDGAYLTGVNSASLSQSAALDDFATYGSQFGGPISLSVDSALVDLPRDVRLLAPGDDSKGELHTAQAIQSWTADEDTKFKNNTLYQYRDRDTYSSYQYSEVMRDNWMIGNRAEFVKDFETGGVLHQIIAGISARFTDVVAINDFFHEPANYWDLSRPNSEIGVTDEFVFFDTPFTQFTGPSIPILGERARGRLTLGRPGSVGGDYTGSYELDATNPGLAGVDFDGDAAIDGDDNFEDPNTDGTENPTVTFNPGANNGDTNDSEVTQLGFFLQEDATLTDRFSILLGGRVNYVDVDVVDPMYDDIVAYLTEFGAAGEAARFIANNPAADSETHDEVLYSGNISAVYKLTDTSTVYATANYAESPPVGLGGGISVSQARNTDTFVRESELFELGYKATFLEGMLFFNTAIFHQTRNDPQQGGGSVETEARGFEVELNYQPNNRLWATFGYSYIDAESDSTSFIAAGAPFSGSANTPSFPNGESETPGVPDQLLNFLMSYKVTDNAGFRLGAIVTSPFLLTYDIPGQVSSAEVPWQFNIDAGVFYENERLSVAFNVLNVTDEENFGAVNPIYGNASLYTELPRIYEVSASYRF